VHRTSLNDDIEEEIEPDVQRCFFEIEEGGGGDGFNERQ